MDNVSEQVPGKAQVLLGSSKMDWFPFPKFHIQDSIEPYEKEESSQVPNIGGQVNSPSELIAAPVKLQVGYAVGIETVIKLLEVSVHPLASVTTRLSECVKLVSPKGTEGSLKMVFRFVSIENKSPSTSHSYDRGGRPSEAFDVIIFPHYKSHFGQKKMHLVPLW